MLFAAGKKPALRPAFTTQAIGMLLNSFAPARLGDLARAYLMGESEKESKFYVLGTVAIEKLLDLGFLVVLVLLLITRMVLPGWLADSFPGLIGGIIIATIVIGLLVWQGDRLVDFLTPRLAGKGPVARLISSKWVNWAAQKIHLGLRSLEVFRQPRQLSWVLVWSVVTWVQGVLTNSFVFLALGLKLPFWVALLLLIVLQAGLVVPSSPGRIGVFDYLTLITLVYVGIDKETALSCGVVLHLVAMGPIALVGMLCLWWEKVTWNKLAEMATQLKCPGQKGLMISVIIPANNSEKTLPACLKALLHQTQPPDEVVIVNNGAGDVTLEFARQAGVKVIQQAHLGAAAARNLGVQQAQGDLILFTNPDCEPEDTWVERMSAPFQDPSVVGTKGVYRTRQPGLVARFVQQEYESKYAHMARLLTIDFIDTYSAAYRRDIFLENEGFDPAFPAPSVEDQEFSFRLARKGYRLVFVPQAIVYHQHNSTLGQYFRRKYSIGYWKAFMLHWLPEKAFNDSHTLPSQRWQILLLGLLAASLGLSLFWNPGLWLALAWLILFYASDYSFLAQIWKKDRPVLWAVPGLLLCRAFALGMGLLIGFLFPPKAHRRVSAGFILGQRAFKRLLDIVVSLVGLVVSSPILAVAGLFISIDSPGPVFFSQPRCGENGRPFRIVKLRTMVVGAEQQLEQVMNQNQLKSHTFKIPGDPRVTRVGRFLRRWSLDEIPQLWNVLRGEMSLVGPRPEETWVVAHYNDYQRQRLLLKPGMTGPMQVYGRGDLDLDARLNLELEYIQHYSLWKDVEILLRTIPAIISGEGAY